MLNIKLACIFVVYTTISHIYGDRQRDSLCDVGQWFANLTQHIDDEEVELNGRQSSSLRKIRQLIEDYNDKRVVKPCFLLTKYVSIILEDIDEEIIDFNELDITNQQTTKKDTDEHDELNDQFHDNGDTTNQEKNNQHQIGLHKQDEKYEHEEGNPDISHIKDSYHGEGVDEFDVDPTDLSSSENNDDDHNGEYDDSVDHDRTENNGQQYVGTLNDQNDTSQNFHNNGSYQEGRRDSPTFQINMFFSYPWMHHTCGYWDFVLSNTEIISKEQREAWTVISMKVNGDFQDVEQVNMSEKSQVDQEDRIKTQTKTINDVSQNIAHEEIQDDSAFKSNNVASTVFNEAKEDQMVQIMDAIRISQQSKTKVSSPKKTCLCCTNLYINYFKTFFRSNSKSTTNKQIILTDKQRVSKTLLDRGDYKTDKETPSKEESNDQQRNGFSGQNENDDINNDQNYSSEILNEGEIKDDTMSAIFQTMAMSEMTYMMKEQNQQQTKKIDKLELEIVRLENKVLSQSLDMHHGINNVQHLENHIMKLENNLLKLNQSYNELQSDHNNFKKRHQNMSNTQTCLDTNIRPKTNRNSQLITQQRSQIWELSQITANQTNKLQQIQRKSTFLEEQNEYLFKMVMDQSALITNMLTQIQELNENCVKTKLETKELKLLFDHVLTTHTARRENRHSKEETEEKSDIEHSNEIGEKKPDYKHAHDNKPGNEHFHEKENKPDNMYSEEEEKSEIRHFQEEKEEENKSDSGHFPKVEEKSESGNVQEEETGKTDSVHLQGEVEIRSNMGDSQEKEEHKSTKRHFQMEEEIKADIEHSHEENAERIIESENPSDKDLPREQNDNDDKERQGTKVLKVMQEKGREQKNKTHKRVPQQPIVHTILYPPKRKDKPHDCYEVYTMERAGSGEHTILVSGLDMPTRVSCNMDDGGAGGWTILLRRNHGAEDFYRDDKTYAEGFGSPHSEHYLGNEILHYLTNQKDYKLKVELTDWSGQIRHAIYNDFWLDGDNDQFKLHVHGYSGTAGDGLGKHNGMKFSTFDVDNDLLKTELGGSCAKRFHGAGWYYKCYQSNLMGVYYEGGEIPDKRYDGITWKPWTGPKYSLKSVVMSIRPKGVE